MRILFLTCLILAPLYYFNRTPEAVHHEEKLDAIKLKMSAPGREVPTIARPSLVMETSVPEVSAAVEEDSEAQADDEDTSAAALVAEATTENTEHFEENGPGDLEAGWNSELKTILERLEPLEAETIHQTYVQEQQNYRTELEGLMNEKQLKSSEEDTQEMELVIDQLDQKHQERLKEVLGAHYEAVRDHYDQYMESSSTEE